MDRGSLNVLHGSSSTIDVLTMMTVQLICSPDVYKNWCLHKQDQPIWHYWKADLMETVNMDFYLMEGTRHLYITGEASAVQASRLLTKTKWNICISQVKHLLFKPQGSWQRLSEKQITVITQAQAFKFDISSYLYPSYQIREKGEKFYNAFAQKWISPWRMFPSNRECVLQ
jgi:hypothetical protein